MMLPRTVLLRCATSTIAMCLIWPLAATAQSAASEASAESVVAVSTLPGAGLALLGEGARFSVAALRPVGASIEVVLIASAGGGDIVLTVSGDAVTGAGLSVGATVTASAAGAGHLLHVAGRAFAFVPSQAAAALMHRRELTR